MKERILTKSEVFERGVSFESDSIGFGGKYGDQVCLNPNTNDETPFNGLLYEVHNNENLMYYQYFVEGTAQGHGVKFNIDGTVKKITNKKRKRQ